MKIIIVNDYARVTGGADQIALSSARALSAKGFDITLFSAVADKPIFMNKNIKLISTNQKDILNDPKRYRAVQQGIWNNTAAKRFSNLLEKFNPDKTVIHIHSWTKALSSSVIKVALTKKYKTVVTLHDYFTICPNGGLFNYKTNSICKKNAMSLGCILTNCDQRNYFQKQYRVIRQFVQRSFGEIPDGLKNIIYISNFSRQILEPYMPKESKQFMLSNIIDVEHSKPVDVENNNQIIMVGRTSPEKGPELFAEASRRIEQRAVIIGGGNNIEDLKKINAELEITGWLSHDQVIEHMRLGKILVLPSLWYETQGLVVAEAAALGIPAIVPDTCAARDMVIDGETGFWFNSGDVADLVTKLRTILTGSLAAKMGRAAYDLFWSNPPTHENHVAQLIKIYQKVLESD